MTFPKMKPCPKCGNVDLSIYTYDNGWRHVECDECLYLGPGEGSKAQAVKQHNAGYEARAKEAKRARIGHDGGPALECEETTL